MLYDVSSSYVEGHCCPLAKRGYNRDGKKGKLQIVYGLLCAADGCPVAIEVFKPAPAQAGGNTGDPKTLATQIDKLKGRFSLARVVLVGDRGMITQARIREDVIPANLDWITALRAPDIKALAEGGRLQLTLFDERNMAVITSPDFPGERLIVCRNPDLAAERTRRRNDLLAATQRDLDAIKERVERKRAPLHGADKIGIAVGAVLGRHKMAKHFAIEIADDRFAFCRNQAEIAAETARDGIYVIRTNLPADAMTDPQVVASYKSLSQVERAFRSIKTVDLEIRPIYHWLEDRVRAHVLLCMLAYHVEWHMRAALGPMLYEDDEKETSPGRTLKPGGQGATLRQGAGQASLTPHCRWPAGSQLPKPDRRPRHDLPQHLPHRPQPRSPDHHRHSTNTNPSQGIRTARHPADRR